MCIGFVLGWQRFIEAFGIVPDRWKEDDRLPWRSDDEMGSHDEMGSDEMPSGDERGSDGAVDGGDDG